MLRRLREAMEPAPAEPVLGRRVAVAMGLALFVVSLNLSMMTVLMVPISRDLGIGLATVQNGLVLMPLVAFAFLPTGRRLGAIYGHKRAFKYGLAFFGFGLVATAGSPNVAALIFAFGIITGIGATPLMTFPWMLLGRALVGLRRDLGLLLLSVATVSGALAGSLVGGFVDTASDWRFAFLLPLPLVIAMWFLVRPVDEVIERSDAKVDWTGAVLSLSGLILIVMGVNLSNEYGWWVPLRTPQVAGIELTPFSLSIVPFVMAVGALLMVGFIARWRRVNRAGDKAQIWQLGVLRQRQFDIGVATNLFFAFGLAGFTYTLFLFLQSSVTFSMTSLDAALTVLPYNITMILALLITIRLGYRVAPKYIIQIGLFTAIVGLWLLLGAFAPAATARSLVPGLVVVGIGAGLVIGYLAPLTLSVVGHDHDSEARGLLNSVQDLSYAVGISVFGLALISLIS
ncbi:MAG: MFS transporter, partial [Acidimicrobiales bacterium]